MHEDIKKYTFTFKSLNTANSYVKFNFRQGPFSIYKNHLRPFKLPNKQLKKIGKNHYFLNIKKSSLTNRQLEKIGKISAFCVVSSFVILCYIPCVLKM